MNDAEKFAAAKAILVDVLCEFGKAGQHSPECAFVKFANHHRIMHPSHPVWKSAPACNCVIGRVAQFLKDN